jgi:hypothetical protein
MTRPAQMSVRLDTRPPTSGRASSTVTSKPASRRKQAAVSPAKPAPITVTRWPFSGAN